MVIPARVGSRGLFCEGDAASMVAGRRSLFGRPAAGRPLEKSAEARLEFIGIPPRVVGPTDSSQTCFDSQRVSGRTRWLDSRIGKRRPFLCSLMTKFC